jgi:AcrR family transcriptional regulator
MERDGQDRRTRNTRQRLRQALLELLKKNRYGDISIQDITERADVARSTFYTHYVDKDDLLTGAHGIFAENLDQQMTAHAGVDGSSAFSSLQWFHHIQAQGEILKVIAKDPAMDLAMKTLRGIIHRSVEEGLQAHAGMDENAGIPTSVTVDYLTDALLSLIKWWFAHGMTHTPEEMDDMFRRLVTPGIQSIMRGASHETR